MILRPLLLLLLLSGPALAAPGEWRARVGLETGADTNPERLFTTHGGATSPSAMLSAVGSLDGRLRAGNLSLSGGWDLGLRGFFPDLQASTLVQAARGELSLDVGPSFSLVTRVRGKDRRGADREYSDLQLLAGVAWLPDAQLSVELLALGSGFAYREDARLGFVALGGTLNALYRFDRRHSLTLFGEASERHFDGTRARDREPAAPGVIGARRRYDDAMLVGASYSYRGPFALTAAYSYAGLDSNSFGETVQRHRVSVVAGVPLFWDLTLLAQLGLQFARYPDGIYLSPELIVLEDDENQNSAALKLTRPLGESLDLEVRWSIHQNRLRTNGFDYLRQVGGIGLTWRLR